MLKKHSLLSRSAWMAVLFQLLQVVASTSAPPHFNPRITTDGPAWQAHPLECVRDCHRSRGKASDARFQYSCDHATPANLVAKAANPPGFTLFGAVPTVLCSTGFRTVSAGSGWQEWIPPCAYVCDGSAAVHCGELFVDVRREGSCEDSYSTNPSAGSSEPITTTLGDIQLKSHPPPDGQRLSHALHAPSAGRRCRPRSSVWQTLSLRGGSESRRFSWVQVQKEGNGSPSLLARVWRAHFGRPIKIDALKNTVKGEFSPRVEHVCAADLKVYDHNQQELTTPWALVEDEPVGNRGDNPLCYTLCVTHPATLQPGTAPEKWVQEEIIDLLADSLLETEPVASKAIIRLWGGAPRDGKKASGKRKPTSREDHVETSKHPKKSVAGAAPAAPDFVGEGMTSDSSEFDEDVSQVNSSGMTAVMTSDSSEFDKNVSRVNSTWNYLLKKAFSRKEFDTALEIIEEELPWADGDDEKKLRKLRIFALNKQLDLATTDEERIKVLNKQLDLATTDDERLKVLNKQLDLLRNMLETNNTENLLLTKMDVIFAVMKLAPAREPALKDEWNRARDAVDGFAGKQASVDTGKFQYPLVDADRVARCLAQPFRQRRKGLTALDKTVLGITKDCKAHNYVTVFQSSGMGKTKWALSLKERDLAHVVYLHLGGINPSYRGNGWPNPDPFPLMSWAFSFALDPARSPTPWRTAVNKLKIMIALTISRSCAEFTNSDPSLCPDTFTYKSNRRKEKPDNDDEKDEDTDEHGDTDCRDHDGEAHGVQYSTFLRAISADDWDKCDIDDCLHAIAQFQSTSNEDVIVVWDEAASMNLKVTVTTDGLDPPHIGANSYSITARTVAIAAIDELAKRFLALTTRPTMKQTAAARIANSRSLPFAHVFVATTSGASSADARLGSTDDSLRFLRGVLPAPVTGFVENLDVAITEQPHRRSGMVSIPRTDIATVACYGRPLWSTTRPCNLRMTWEETVGQYAGSKLLGGTLKPKATWDTLTDEEFLAVVMSRIAGFTVPIQQAERLVRSHMAIAKNVVSGNQVQAGYVSEPVLAGGSKLLSAELGGFGCSSMTKKLATCFSASPISAGDVGEIAAIVVLLKAMDMCCRQSNFQEELLPACSLTNFLDTLLGEVWREKITTKLNNVDGFQPAEFLAALANQAVSFNHFFRIELEEEVDWPATLAAAYRRCGAIICQQGYRALDLVIPTSRALNEEEFQYSGVLIQARNTKDSFAVISKQENACVFPFDKRGVVPGLFLGLRMVKGKRKFGRAGIIEKIAPRKKRKSANQRLVGYVASSFLDLACLSDQEVDALEELCALHRTRDLNSLHLTEGPDDTATEVLGFLDWNGAQR